MVRLGQQRDVDRARCLAGTTYVKPLGPFVDNRVRGLLPGRRRPPGRTGLGRHDQRRAERHAALGSATADGADDGRGGVHRCVHRCAAAAAARERRSPAPDTTAVHIAIVDDDSGQLIYGEQPNTEVPQASTTKIATTIVALERSPDLSQRIKVTVSASAMVARDGSSTMGIEPGQSVSLRHCCTA